MIIRGDVLNDQLTTCGSYATEAAAAIGFDAALERHPDAFWAFSEITGEVLQPRLRASTKSVRIDRLLTPKPAIRNAGWNLGAIGVELKRSGQKAGRPICQLLDYSRSIFFLPSRAAHLRVALEWTFLFPIDATYCDIATILAQNRIGTCHVTRDGSLEFLCAAQHAIVLGRNGSIWVRPPICGNKTGSR